MSRLASQEKMGYYPTPEDVVLHLKNILEIPPHAKLLDTCCGEGEALNLLAEDTGALTYGCELDKVRYEKAKQKLNYVLWCDSVNELICSKKSFDLLFLNPPYDYDLTGTYKKNKRLELLFLEKHFPLLKENGILILIVPLRIVSKCLPYLIPNCKEIHLIAFPTNYYSTYYYELAHIYQVILLCIKGKPSPANRENSRKLLKKLQKDPYITIYDIETSVPNLNDFQRKFELPEPSPDLIPIFKCTRIDPDEVAKKLQNSPLWQKLEEEMHGKIDLSYFKPVMPLREGHLAMLLASGLINGEIEDKNEKLIIKGTVYKTQQKKEEETEEEVRHKTIDEYKIKIHALRLHPEPEIFVIE